MATTKGKRSKAKTTTKAGKSCNTASEVSVRSHCRKKPGRLPERAKNGTFKTGKATTKKASPAKKAPAKKAPAKKAQPSAGAQLGKTVKKVRKAVGQEGQLKLL